MIKNELKVLITGVGSPAAPGVIKSLRRITDCQMKIIGMDIASYLAAASMVDQFLIGPKASDDHFIAALMKVCAEEKIDVILPLVTAELPKFAKHREDFMRAGTLVSVSDYEKIVLAVNKGTLFKKLELANIPVPDYRIANTADQLNQAFHDLSFPNVPVCFKPTVSDGSRGFRILDPTINRLQLLFREKPNSTYISENELFEIIGDSLTIPELVVMEYLPGHEYSVDILANQGKVMVAIPRLREQMTGGISTRGVIVKADDVIDYTTAIVKHLGLHGNIGVQVRRDIQNRPKIIEINPRIQGTIIHCTAAGVNLPVLAVKLATNIPIDPQELEVKWGTRMIRYWEEIYYDPNGSPYALELLGWQEFN